MENRKLLSRMVNPVWWVIMGILARLIPHAPNFTPVGAIALFAGANLKGKWCVLLPLSVMILSDIFLGFDSWGIRMSVYGSFVLISLLGMFLRNKSNALTVATASVAGSGIFFLITNWAVWQFGSLYQHTQAGLVEAYFMGVPFLRNMLMGDLVYNAAFFGSFTLARGWRWKRPNVARIEIN